MVNGRAVGVTGYPPQAQSEPPTTSRSSSSMCWIARPMPLAGRWTRSAAGPADVQPDTPGSSPGINNITPFSPSVGIFTLPYVIRDVDEAQKLIHSEIGQELVENTVRDTPGSGFWSILAPLVILGGIYSGYFTPTEAAIVAIFYTLFVGFVIHRELKWQAISHCLTTTTWLTGRVLLILFTATVFGRLLVENRIPAIHCRSHARRHRHLYILWTIIILFLLFVGMFMETLATILILTPVLLPIGYNLGIDPTHFGIVMICALAVGFQTPPLGENLFIASGVSKATIEEIFVKIMPFTVANILGVFLIAFIPELTLWLPRLFGF